MNKKEQVIRYLDGQMNEEEKLHFEKMLTEDPELQKETDRSGIFLLGDKSWKPPGDR